MNMGSKDMTLFHNKLDKILDTVTELKVTTAKLETHQKDINGTIIEVKEKCDGNDKAVQDVKGSIFYAKGMGAALGVLATLLGAVALTKSLGLW